MIITHDIMERYIIPHDYEKPRIEIGNYYLKWNDKSYGISQKELSDLKGFLRNALRYFDIIYELLNSLEISREKEKRHLQKELSPHIHFSRSNKDLMLSYDLYMASDGSTFIDRTERFEIINKDESELSKSTNVQQIRYNNSEFYLKWNLGELLFNRQGVVGIKE
jgi:hypothetical protein